RPRREAVRTMRGDGPRLQLLGARTPEGTPRRDRGPANAGRGAGRVDSDGDGPPGQRPRVPRLARRSLESDRRPRGVLPDGTRGSPPRADREGAGVKGLVLDLFSGTGSATQPFVECGRHRVVRVDHLPLPVMPDGTPHTRPSNFEFIQADIRDLNIREFEKDRPEFIWASPPCQQFSTANPRRDPEKGLELVRVA